MWDKGVDRFARVALLDERGLLPSGVQSTWRHWLMISGLDACVRPVLKARKTSERRSDVGRAVSDRIVWSGDRDGETLEVEIEWIDGSRSIHRSPATDKLKLKPGYALGPMARFASPEGEWFEADFLPTASGTLWMPPVPVDVLDIYPLFQEKRTIRRIRDGQF